MAILSDSPRTATVTAAEPTTALRIDKRVFLELLMQFPQMSLAVLREITRRLERTNTQLAAKSSS
jgi:CRP-like cAMP-binding protein